jgi:O-methyltransferase
VDSFGKRVFVLTDSWGVVFASALREAHERFRRRTHIQAAHRKFVRQLRFLRKIPLRDLGNPRKAILALRVHPHTMLDYPRVATLYELANTVERERVPGVYVECGVARGGSSALVGSVLRRSGRQLWLFDSWEGLPDPGEDDVSVYGKVGYKGMDLAGKEEVQELLFQRFRLPRDRYRLVKGWFRDTLPAHRDDIGSIALLHLDGDWYESIMVCLEQLYELVVPGGYVAIDDYGYWKGCKKAVDEFVTRNALAIDLMDVDGVSVFFRKPLG